MAEEVMHGRYNQHCIKLLNTNHYIPDNTKCALCDFKLIRDDPEGKHSHEEVEMVEVKRGRRMWYHKSCFNKYVEESNGNKEGRDSIQENSI